MIFTGHVYLRRGRKRQGCHEAGSEVEDWVSHPSLFKLRGSGQVPLQVVLRTHPLSLSRRRIQSIPVMVADTFRPEDLGYDFGNASDSYEDDNSSDCCRDPLCDTNPVQGFARSFLPPFYSLICFLGLWGNGMVIAVLLRAKEALPRTDVFILNLAIADILLVLTLPFWAVQEVYGWIFGEFLCKVVGGIFKINFYASIFFLVCISFDRYLSIVHVIRMYNRNSTSVFRLFSLALWLLCLLLTLPDFRYLSTDFDSRQDLHSCALNLPGLHWKIALSFVNQIGAFLLPLLGMAYFYTHIISILLVSKGLHKYKALRVIFAVVAAFFLCWSPYHVVHFINTLIDLEVLSSDCKREEQVDVAEIIGTALGFFHCCLNPLLYAFIGVKFRNKFLDLFERLGCVTHSFLVRYARPSSQRKDSTWSESTTFSGL